MSMPDKAFMRNNHVVAHRLPVVEKRKKSLGIFLLLQIYFTSNILSFGFWKSGSVFFGYQIVFFGTWLVGLVLLLFLFLKVSSRFGLVRFDPVIFLVFSLPFCFWLWLQPLGVLPDKFWWHAIWIIPLLFVYYRFGVLYNGIILFVMISLCIMSFMGHSDILAKSERFKERHPSETDIITLDRKTSIHMIIFDSLAPSAFINIFLGAGNPAADYLSMLDDTIYAGNMGFVEYFPTRNFYGSTFELEKDRGHYTAFSGHSRSFLTDLLRKNGYYIQTGFGAGYLGLSQGEYVDHYEHYAVYLRASLLCADRVSLLGFCSEFSDKTIYKTYRYWFFSKQFKQRSRTNWVKKVRNLIDQAESSQPGPVFSVFHINSPGHTGKTFRTDDPKMLAEFKDRYLKQTEYITKWIEDINQLRKRYPDSIYIISGDHGPYLNWTKDKDHKDRSFIVLGRHNIALAMLNAANLCHWSKNWLEQQRYLTPSRMLAASLACDGESRKLTEHFEDNEEFIRFGESLTGWK